MIGLEAVYWLAGGYFTWVAWCGVLDRGNPRRHTTALFWALLAVALLFGERLPAALTGVLVVLLALLAGLGGLRRGHYAESSATEQSAEARRLGHRLFWPALLIPGITLLVAVVLKDLELAGSRLFSATQTTLVGLGLACAVALVAACWLTRQRPGVAIEQSRRLLDSIGWAALLPLLLATLGSVFSATGVGEAVAAIVQAVIPADSRLAAVLAYALGMAAFTMIMGNAFAAFPVITAGVGLPLLVAGHGADAAPLAAIGMLSGYCGTLMTPMAANFNLVPAALLELDDPYAVIRVQIGTALPLLACNVVLMYVIPFTRW